MSTYRLALLACAVWVGMTASDIIYESLKDRFGWFGGADWSSVPHDAWEHAWTLAILVLAFWLYREY